MSLWILLAAPFIGVLLGMFGAGGGMVTVPLLTYGAGVPLKTAIATSVWIVAAVSILAALQQRAWQVVRLRLLIFFGLGGVLGGIGGAWLGTWIDAHVQQLLFGLLLLLVAWWTSRRRLIQEPLPEQHCRCGWALLAGYGLGVLTGLLGVGGGFLMVPTLIALGISHMPTAVAHSLVLISLNAVASGLMYAQATPVAWELMLVIVALAAIGSVFGTYFLKRISTQKLQRGLSAGLALIGLTMLVHGGMQTV